MNKETIKKLIQLTPEQRALLDVVEQSLRALSESGVSLFYDFENYNVCAINCNRFLNTEADDVRYENEWKEKGFVMIPYWEGEVMADYFCAMCTDDYLYGEINPAMIEHDKNLFNE